MTLVTAWAALVVTLNHAAVLDANIILDSSAGKTLTAILAFLIVFRTNQSYNRWWEGRILWGKMHSSCVELSQQAAVWIDDPRLARRIMNFAVAFAYTVKKVLRREPLRAEDLEGIVDPAEVTRMECLPLQAKPYYCTDVIRQCIKRGLTEHPQTYGAQAVARGIDMPVSQLSAQYADMARVRNTPQPDCFRVLLHMFTVIYLLMLPVISYDALGYWVIPEVVLTSYLMLGLQFAASDLEDPFGYDLSDLELDLFVSEIAHQCREAFYMGEKKGFDLTLEDGGAAADSNPDGHLNHSLHEIGDSADCNQSTEPMDSRDRGGKGGVTPMGWVTSNSVSPEPVSPASPSPSGSTPHGCAMSEAAAAATAAATSLAICGSPSGLKPSYHQSLREHKSTVGAAVPGGPFSAPARYSSFMPKVVDYDAAMEATMAAASTGGSGHRRGRSRNRAERRASPHSGKPVDNSGSSVGFVGRLAIRQRTQDDLAPRRHSTKPRPGRGKSPLVEQGRLALPPPELQQYNFDQQEAALRAAIV
ncbi:unnamed protein product [Ascophyllum nodosum]